MLAGVSCGAFLWWCLVAGGVTALRDRFTDKWLEMVNRIAGIALIVFASAIAASLF